MYGTEAVEAIFLDTSKIGKVDLGPDHIENLKHINLSYSKHLIQIPNLSRAPKLEAVNLQDCTSLLQKFPELPRNIVTLDLSRTAIEEVPLSIKNVSALEVFRLTNCKRLKYLPTSICKLKKLSTLSLSCCSKLESFPEILEPMESLESLDLQQTGIKGLPRISFVNLIKLRCLLLDECEKLAFVPHSIFCMSSVEELSFSNCPLLELLPTMSKIGLDMFVLFLSGLNMLTTLNMINCSLLKLPDWLGCLSSLKTLELSGNLIDEIPKSIKKLNGSIELHISNCGNLRSLPELPLSLGYLDVSGCTSLQTLFEESPIVSICYPGNEISKWFNYQSEKSSMTIKLTPDWHENNFIGFALSTVVAF
ncbi:LRR domain containing protein [Parasponia andersonii]|uniref:LRR domain containing protein n=1 Tax=Parasponia andersonii TaxID=3476 RepID=A0A2P5CBX5_PARAD|nr:LRR domain containing protein [Parasponia andersonii]